MSDERKRIMEALRAPFDPADLRWKPGAVTADKSRALAMCYVTARAVMDRLDEVLGVGNWQTHHRESKDGIVCTLRVRILGEWTEHEDKGNYSDQPDEGDQEKAAYSDSLKRAAVRVGIGRYLYGLPAQWCDYDPKRKQIISPPSLPKWALPSGNAKQSGSDPVPIPEPKKQAAQPEAPAAITAEDLEAKIKMADQLLYDKGLAARGALAAEIDRWGFEQGLPAEFKDWPADAIQAAYKHGQEYKDRLVKGKAKAGAK